nr:GTP-binding protein [Streptomyces sp. IMTB 2501]
MSLAVAVVGGLHAEARKAAVDRLLADVPGSVVLHHDLATATAGTVVRTVRDRGGILSAGEAPLVNDCACCALREDLVPELRRLAADGTTRLAIVELWDSVEPKAMAEVVASGGLTVTSVITAVDPALVLPYLGNGDDLAEAGLAAAATDQRTIADTFARQLEYAPVLALADSPEADDEDRELLAQLHPTARQVPIGHGGLAGTTPTDGAPPGATSAAAGTRTGPRVHTGPRPRVRVRTRTGSRTCTCAGGARARMARAGVARTRPHAPPAGPGGSRRFRRGGRRGGSAPGLCPAARRGRQPRRVDLGLAPPPALPPGAAVRGAGGPDLRRGP